MIERNGWHFVEGTKADHWVDLYYFQYGEPWAKAAVKWDGCIHLNTVANEPYVPGKPATEQQMESYTHLCGGVEHFIKMLRELEAAAKDHFAGSGGWPR
jgi:hypothetical protein